MANPTYDELMAASDNARRGGDIDASDRLRAAAEQYQQATKGPAETQGLLPHLMGSLTSGIGGMANAINPISSPGGLGGLINAGSAALGGPAISGPGGVLDPTTQLQNLGGLVGLHSANDAPQTFTEALGGGIGTAASLLVPMGAGGKALTTIGETTLARIEAAAIKAGEKAAAKVAPIAPKASLLTGRTTAAARKAAAEATAAAKEAARVAAENAARTSLTAKAAGLAGKTAKVGGAVGESVLTPSGAYGLTSGLGMGSGISEMAREHGAGPGMQAAFGMLGGIEAPLLGMVGKAAVTKLAPAAMQAAKGAAAGEAGAAAAVDAGVAARLGAVTEGRGPQLAATIDANRATPSILKGLTGAELSRDQTLLSAERALIGEHPAAMADHLSRMKGLSEEARRAMMGDAIDPSNAQPFFKKTLADEAASAAKAGTSVLDAVAPKVGVMDASTAAVDSMKAAKAVSKKAQSDMWEALPKYQAPISNTRSVLETIARDRGRLSVDWPSNVRKLADALGDKRIVAVDIKPLNNMYSDLRRAIRAEARNANPNNDLIAQYEKLAGAITKDFDSIPTSGVGAKIMDARAATRAHYDTYGNEGYVDKMIRNSVSGNKNPASLALEKTLGTGRKTAEGAAQLLAGDPKSAAAIETVLRDRFIKSATSGSKTFKAEAAENWLRAHRDVLSMPPFQKLGGELRGAVDKAKASGASKTSHAATFAAKPKTAIKNVLEAENPAQEMAALKAVAAKDKSGKAMKGLEGALVDHIVVGSGKTKITGERLGNMLADPRVEAAVTELMGPDRFAQFKRLADELSMVQMPVRDVEELLKTPTSKTREAIGRFIGLHVPGGQSSLQLQSIKSNIGKNVLAPDNTAKIKEKMRGVLGDQDTLLNYLRGGAAPPPVGPVPGAAAAGDIVNGLIPKTAQEVTSMLNPLLTAIMGGATVAGGALKNQRPPQ